MEEKIKKVSERIQETIDKLNKKDFTIYFFVIDTKGTPNGSTQYIYETASELIESGYNCKMLYQQETKKVQEKTIVSGKEVITMKEVIVPFVGVCEWLGEKYSTIIHSAVDNENVKMSAADFLIIPEIFANVMNQTKDLPCKRIILCQNVNYITEFIPLGSSWADYKIFDVITTSEIQADDIKSLFPYVRTQVINPSIPNYFRNNDEPKKLVISIVTKDQTNVNKIVKQFHWKYPQYSWVTFTDLRGLNREKFADTLRESAITITIDDDAYFGYSPIEAIKSGSLVIGKIPNVIPEWMYNEDKTSIVTNGIWFNDMRDIHSIIAQTVKLWLEDEIPELITNEMAKTALKYTPEAKQVQLNTVFGKYVTDRVVELEEIKKLNTEKK
jgi:hypothetical protein